MNEYTPRSPEFDQRVIDYIPYLRKLANKFERNPMAREDLVQETVLTVLAKHQNFRPDGGWVNWLTFQMRGVISNHRRKKNREVEDPDGRHAGMQTEPPRQDDAVYLKEVIAAMPERRRADILLHATGLTFREIGARRGVSTQAASAAVMDAMVKVREQLH